MTIKSNFLPLLTINKELFNVGYSAEQLFVSNQYHFVPTALRIFVEGVMQEVVNQTSFRPQLNDLINQFTIEKPTYNDIASAARKLQYAGNKASHFKPTTFSRGELEKYFTAAMTLQNFYLLSYLKKDVVAIQFDSKSLPDVPVGYTNLNEKLNHAVSQTNADSVLLEKITRYEKQIASLKADHETYQKALRTAKSSYESHQKEKETLNTKLKEVLRNRDAEIARIKNESAKGEVTLKQKAENKSKEYENEIDSLNSQILRLTEQNNQLEIEKNLFESKINENLRAQAEQEPIKESLIDEVDLIQQQSEKEALFVRPTLDSAQEVLVAIKEGRHFVIAPPGAGKTAILTQRLDIALSNYQDNEIACLTFTTKAAKEMQNRAASILNGRRPFIGNFHNLCLDVYRQNNELPIQSRFSSILPDNYRHEFFEKALAAAKADNNIIVEVELPQLLESLIEGYAKEVGDGVLHESATRFDRYLFYRIYPYLCILQNEQSSLHEFSIQQLKQPLLQAIIACHKSMYGSNQSVDLVQGCKYLWMICDYFIKSKSEHRAIDYDDILCLGLMALSKNPQPRKFLQVDEVQDLNPIQWKIIDVLTNKDTHVFVVGDKDQAIYGFLGADVKGLDVETSAFTTHNLLNNYRSDKAIISLLNKYRNDIWGKQPIEPCSEYESSAASTMLLKYETKQKEIIGISHAVGKIVEDKSRNVGVLLSTNKAVDEFCVNFAKVGLKFFRVSSNDIMQQDIIQDWLSLIKAHKGNAQNVDWYNLLNRFTQFFGQANKNLDTVINVVNGLSRQGVCLSDVISEPFQQEGLFQYRLRKLVKAWESDSVVTFDMITTGVDFDTDKIIQLSAVKVKAGKVVDEFNKIINIDLETAQPCLINSYEQSEGKHHISRSMLSEGETEADVLNGFLTFVGSSPLVAHDINFQIGMLRMAIMRTNSYELLRKFQQASTYEQFDTLLLARLLLPNESSYSREELLTTYQLYGVQSDDALSEAMATSALLSYLIDKVQPRLHLIDQIIDENANLINIFSEKYNQVNSQLKTFYATGEQVKLSELLNDWLDFAVNQDNWYPDIEAADIADIKSKLCSWLDDNGYHDHIHQLFNEFDPKTQELITLKESDLINPDKDKLIVSTIHRAKGLEFETVIIPQVTNQHFPGFLPNDASESQRLAHNEEKQRLLYVAMSRPVNKLIMSYHSYGETGNFQYKTDLYEPISECISCFQYTR